MIAATLFSAAARVLATGGSILCYHGVTTVERPGASIVHVPLDRLAGHLAALRRTARIVPLRELIERHSSGRSTVGLAAVTFDDAYDSLIALEGLLLAGSVPITVFVVADAARAGARYWWDRIDDAFAKADRAQWSAFEDRIGLPRPYRDGQPREFGPLRPLRQWLLAEFRGRWPAPFEPALAEIESEIGSTTAQRSMTFDELARFAGSPLVDVGVHTRSHPVLPLLPDDEMRAEIAGGYADLRERVPRAVAALAVPFGLFDARTLRIARDAGMSAVLSLGGRTLARAARAGSDPIGAAPLPRFSITNAEPDWKIALRASGVADRLRALRGESQGEFPPLPSPTT